MIVAYGNPSKGRTPPGVRELKQPAEGATEDAPRRTPPGVRELKPYLTVIGAIWAVSHPSRGA